MRSDGDAGRHVGSADPAMLARIHDLRRNAEAALATLADAASEGEDAAEVARALEGVRRRASRWRLTEVRVRASASALLTALHIRGVRARDPRAWIDADELVLVVLADWVGLTPTTAERDEVSRRVAQVLHIEAAAVQVAPAGELPAGLLERVWTEGTALSRYA